ncbi:hypothetical protein DY245_42740 [Streptomyces inhibens]|uniref:Uncharacterized protein n=1 Tax=Streptomyces inhibens TaxID=2293571 RepID=A0A371PPW8_STRIH|nr:hypothetical protein [Streptomyces inhibens]REK84545.1 hypothetical protein DY245_42740 [Streptomyces inhibens]
MEITEQDGLVIASVNQREAEESAWKATDAPVDVVRLTGSENVDDATLAHLGFVVRPRWINWVSSLGSSEEEFVSALSGTERRNIRLGRRFIQDEKLRVDVQVGLTEPLLDKFLVVYEAQVAGMPRGKNIAREWREQLLAAPSEYTSVCVYSGTTMVAGSLWWMRHKESILQLRFSAAFANARSSRVMRAAYVQAFEFAREAGLNFASLGNDPSLFGHIVQPGLFNFKSRLGFTAIPAQVFGPTLAGEFADRFISLRSLSDPSLVVTWGRHRGMPLIWPTVMVRPGHDLLVLSGEPDVGITNTYRTQGFRESRLLTVPG